MPEHENDDYEGSPVHEATYSKSPSKKSKAHTALKSKRTFEQALAEVEGIVAKLEGGKLELSQSLDEYQRGIGTLKECYDLLESAERRITLLSGFDSDGNPVTEPFEEVSMTIQEKQSARSTRRSAAKPRVSLEGNQAGGPDDDDSQEALF